MPWRIVAVERASELDGGRFVLCNDGRWRAQRRRWKVAAGACPEYQYTATCSAALEVFCAKALSHVPVLAPVMTEYERRLRPARRCRTRAKSEL